MSEIADLITAQGTLAVRVTPRASADRLVVEPEEARLRVYVTTVPEDGKANKAVIALVAKAMGVPKSAISIVRGESARDKLLRIDR